jgi:hypothetical protein
MDTLTNPKVTVTYSVTYSRKESLPGYNNVEIGVTLELASDETETDSAAIRHNIDYLRAIVLGKIDAELEEAGQPAKYDILSPRGQILTLYTEYGHILEDIPRFIVPAEFSFPCARLDRTYPPQRVTYLRQKFPQAIDVTMAADPTVRLLRYLDGLGIVALVNFMGNTEEGQRASLTTIVRPLQIDRRSSLSWFSDEKRLRANIKRHFFKAPFVECDASVLAQIVEQQEEDREQEEDHDLPF